MPALSALLLLVAGGYMSLLFHFSFIIQSKKSISYVASIAQIACRSCHSGNNRKVAKIKNYF